MLANQLTLAMKCWQMNAFIHSHRVDVGAKFIPTLVNVLLDLSTSVDNNNSG